uniref:F-box/LRR-repeat protein n=1 Tax=Heterorhabditis bacteriophora TaxID=37862 RepID=A0A1I7WL80_HETBA
MISVTVAAHGRSKRCVGANLRISLDTRVEEMLPNSIPLLEDFITLNKDTVVDFGLEECSPPHLFTDKLLASLVPGLTSLRLWNNGKCGNYAISDMSVYKLATCALMSQGSLTLTVHGSELSLTFPLLTALLICRRFPGLRDIMKWFLLST